MQGPSPFCPNQFSYVPFCHSSLNNLIPKSHNGKNLHASPLCLGTAFPMLSPGEAHSSFNASLILESKSPKGRYCMVYLCVLHSVQIMWLTRYFLINHGEKRTSIFYKSILSLLIYFSCFLLIFPFLWSFPPFPLLFPFSRRQEDGKGLAVGQPAVKPVAVSASTGMFLHTLLNASASGA